MLEKRQESLLYACEGTFPFCGITPSHCSDAPPYVVPVVALCDKPERAQPGSDVLEGNGLFYLQWPSGESCYVPGVV